MLNGGSCHFNFIFLSQTIWSKNRMVMQHNYIIVASIKAETIAINSNEFQE